MTQEEKQLLLIDLCARLPYKVKVKYIFDDNSHCPFELSIKILQECLDKGFLPYLRPMSSMTEEEKEMLKGSVICFNELEGNSTLFDEIGLDWLNAHYFDYRNLIERGLALEAPEGMYN